MQNDGAFGVGADQYSFFGGLGLGSNLEGALEVCCADSGTTNLCTCMQSDHSIRDMLHLIHMLQEGA